MPYFQPHFTKSVFVFLMMGLLMVGCSSEKAGITENNTQEHDDWSAMILWYRQPAKQWIEALPLGNGRLGAMVYGRTEKEIIQLNEDTIWTGGPYETSEPEGPAALPEIRQLIFEGKYREAQEIFSRIMDTRPRAQQKYQPLGTLELEFPGHNDVKDYRRELNLDTAIASVFYRVGEIKFSREVFVSPVDQVIAIRLKADTPGNISFSAGISGGNNTPPRDETFVVEAVAPDTLILKGKTASYQGVEGRLQYQARIKVIAEGGRINVKQQNLSINGADAVTILIPVATNFVSYKDISGDPEARINKVLAAVKNKSYDRLRAEHVAEHRRLFRRLWLDLGSSTAARLPTNERLKRFPQEGDPQLAAIYFQFGRYLLISSSRPGSQPPNAQGIWNESMNPEWGSRYATNINLEMHYWSAEVTNLSECVEPLVEMVKGLAERGRRTAKLHYGAAGWVLHFNTEIWLPTAPMGGGTLGTWHTAGAWLCTHLWEHYLFNGDIKFLRKVYPIMKGAAQFFLDTLVEHPQHYWLVTSPSSSPENNYTIDGNRATWRDNTTICAGASLDMQLIRDLFDSCAESARILGIDKEFRGLLRQTRRRLAPIQIGKYGQLQEWLEDWDDPNDKHRHLSHLYGLYPGQQITLRRNPKLAAAAKQSLIHRGDMNMGWSRGWKINLWARLEDNERAYKLLCSQLDLQEKEERQHDDEGYWKGGIYPNMFSCGPPRQVDGVFSGCSGIAEMLLQSHSGEIHLLPALPGAWSSGEVRGLRARGGFEVDMVWKDSRIVSATIKSRLGRFCLVRAAEALEVTVNNRVVPTEHPVEMVPYGMKEGSVKATILTEFETEAGGVYEISITK